MKKRLKNSTEPELISKPRSSASEQYRSVRANLGFLIKDKNYKSILITSAEAGAGKTTTGVNLALTFATQGTKVLYIDADLRKPMVHKHLGLSNLKGLTSHLVNDIPLDECIQTKEEFLGLDVLTAGPVPPNPAECLNSKAMDNLLSNVEGIYDLILIDTPPALVVGDAKVLASKKEIDGILLVARHNQTKKAELSQTKQNLKQVDANFIGIVLNDTPKTKHTYYYGA